MAARARQPAPAVHGRRRLGAAPAVGDGHRELRRDRRRLSRGLPDEPGRRTRSRPCSPARTSRPIATSRTAAASRARAAVDGRRSAAVDRVAPGVPGRQQRRVHGPVRVQGQRQRRCPTTRPRTRATCSSASPTARSCRPPTEAGIAHFDRGRGASLVDLNLDGLLDLVRGQPRRAGPRLAQRRDRHGRRAGARWATGSRTGSRQPGGNRDAIGAVVETRVGDHGHRAPRGGRGRRPRQRPAGLDAGRHRSGDGGASCGSRGRTASRARGSGWRPTGLRSSNVARRRPGHGRRAARREADDDPEGTAGPDRPAGLRRTRAPAGPARRGLPGAGGAASCARERSRATTGSSCTRIASTAPTSRSSPGSTRGSRRRCSSSGRTTRP